MTSWTSEAYILVGNLRRQTTVHSNQIVLEMVDNRRQQLCLMLENEGQERINKVGLTEAQLMGLKPPSPLNFIFETF